MGYLEEKYPLLASWVVDGQVQIGQMESWEPLAAVIDHGGFVWSADEDYDSLDTLFDAMEQAIGRWCVEHGIELIDRNGDVIPWPED